MNHTTDAKAGRSGIRADKTKLIGISTLLAVLVTWIGINIAGALRSAPAAVPLETPGWNLAQEITAALVAEPAFADTAVVLESESPLKIKLVGAVGTEADLIKLEAFVAKLRPQKDYEIEVELLDEITNVTPPPDETAATEDAPEEPDTGR